MFTVIIEFLEKLYTRTLFEKNIHWIVTKTEKDNKMFYTIKANFHNEENNKSYTVTISSENNIILIDEDNVSSKKYYMDDEKIISTKNKLMSCVLYNNVAESEKEDIIAFRNILNSKSY